MQAKKLWKDHLMNTTFKAQVVVQRLEEAVASKKAADQVTMQCLLSTCKIVTCMAGNADVDLCGFLNDYLLLHILLGECSLETRHIKQETGATSQTA